MQKIKLISNRLAKALHESKAFVRMKAWDNSGLKGVRHRPQDNGIDRLTACKICGLYTCTSIRTRPWPARSLVRCTLHFPLLYARSALCKISSLSLFKIMLHPSVHQAAPEEAQEVPKEHAQD
jgi:hypothetical protein